MRGRNKYVWCLVVAALALSLSAAPAAAKSSRGLVFPEGAVTVGWKNLEASKRVMVCNGGRTAATLDVRLAGFTFSHTDPATSVPSKYRPPQVLEVAAPPRVDAGRCTYLTLALASPSLVIDPGSYSGAIVAASVGLGVVRQELTITGPGKAPTPATVAAAVETQHLDAENSFPGGGLDLESSQLLLEPPGDGATPLTLGAGCMELKSGSWSASCSFIGSLYRGDDLLEVFIAGPVIAEENVNRLPIRIEGSGEVGDYEGVLDPAGNGEEAEMVKAKLNLTDSIWWAILALLGGTVIALLVQLWTGRWRPKHLLKWRNSHLVDSFVKACVELNSRRVDLGDGTLLKVTLDKAAAAEYADEVKKAIKSYSWSTLLIDTSSDAYKQIESSLLSAEDDCRLLASESGLQKSYFDLDAAIDATEALLVTNHLVGEVPELLTRARALLAERGFSVGDATARSKSAVALIASLKSWRKLAERVLADEAWLFALAQNPEDGDPIPIADADQPILANLTVGLGAVHDELIRAGGDVDLERLRVSGRIEAAHGQMAFLAAKYKVQKPVLKAFELVETASLKDDGNFLIKKYDLEDVQRSDLPDAVGKVKSDSASPVQLPGTRLQLFFFDGLVLFFAAIAAIFSGLALFYFGKTFGTLQDYGTVVVVGAAAQLVVKAILDNASAFWHDISPLSNLEVATAKVMPASK